MSIRHRKDEGDEEEEEEEEEEEKEPEAVASGRRGAVNGAHNWGEGGTHQVKKKSRCPTNIGSYVMGKT